MNLVADEARSLIDKMDAISKSILEIDFVSCCHRNTISDDNHETPSFLSVFRLATRLKL